MENCVHHRICGDGLVVATFPDFFVTHERAKDGREWQVCQLCGDAKQVEVWHDRIWQRKISDKRFAVAQANRRREQQEQEEAMNAVSSSNGHSARAQVSSMPPPITHKVCVRCGERKAIEQYQMHSRGKVRFDVCGACTRAKYKETRAAKATPAVEVVTPEDPEVPDLPEDEMRVKYEDALKVIERQAAQIDYLTERIVTQMKVIVAANRRAHLAEIDLAIARLQAERDMITGHTNDELGLVESHRN